MAIYKPLRLDEFWSDEGFVFPQCDEQSRPTDQDNRLSLVIIDYSSVVYEKQFYERIIDYQRW